MISAGRAFCRDGLVLVVLLLSFPALPAAAPGLSLKGLDGEQHHLSEYIGQGKWVVLNVWGPKCPPCVEEMPELQLFHEEHHDKDAIVVGMALDYPSFGPAKPDEVRAFVDEYFISFPILLGSGSVVPRLGAGPLLGTPMTLLYNPEGELVARQLGAVTGELVERFIQSYRAEHGS